MTKTAVCSVIVAGVYVSAMAVVGAQGAKSVNEGIYSEAQAKRGEAIYKEQCAACHGDNLEGTGPMPPLAGKDFLANWQGKPVADVFEKTQTSMPATAPGSLSPAQTADVVAYMLSQSKYPAGSADMADKAEALKSINLDAPK
jgi:mono/diheme cytochrome c family protein